MTAQLAQSIRLLVLEHAKKAGVGHIGSALSIVDMLASLFDTRNFKTETGADRLVLSKGHAALALYATLHTQGLLTKEDLNGYCVNGSCLGVHPSHAINEIPFSTGSLGQGLSFAVGMALGDRVVNNPRRTYALLSDAECNEGSTWEALLAAGHHSLGNLCALIDYNKQQAFGFTDDILTLEPFADKLCAFNWNVIEVDGHDVVTICQAIKDAGTSEKPTVIVCHTECGKGVSYMEKQVKWHYWSMDDEKYEIAINEVSTCR
ncbi:transketolase [Pseudodesulfovibrio nedwellii]|uniref:Transketolase n=1 Tax=Pseudodesulfovibrio nedwellii TaxID=2973072 RepID=A0ABN6S1X9_9BACT|nr:transketolase [Pseudodesulfovibrio nedwellii]BDQ37227.1 transketolase [Pseudodesulfovibrio nedwellii]